MSILTIALLQMLSHGVDQDANLARADAFCRRAQAMGADVALFPEMWNIGYTAFMEDCGPEANFWRAPERWGTAPRDAFLERAADMATWQARAVDRDGPYVRHFRALARELDMAIGVTYLERWPGAPRNTLSLVDRHGELRLTYAKVHTCDFGMEYACTPGDDFFVCTLDTLQGPVEIGAMICFDREFPESARMLMLKGAEILLIPNACEMEPNRLGQLRARAYENMVGVALANYGAPQQNGHSVAYHPLAFTEEGRSRDTLVVEAGEQEGIVLAAFDLDALRVWRQREVWGGAFRHPHRYGLLTSPEVAPPFVRLDAHGDRYDRSGR